MDLSAFSYRDQTIVERQMDKRVFDARLVKGVSCRCRFGYPQTVACRPFFKSRPFPTLFWLTCPYLYYVCGTIESTGGVHELENWLDGRQKSYNVYNHAYALARQSLLNENEKRYLKLYMPKIWRVISQSGIGGIRRGEKPTVKCLHLQTAAFLSLRGHPGAEWLKRHLGKLQCENGQCSLFA